MEALSNYVLDRPLGAGGMGTVYKAHDGSNGQAVALKVLRPDLAHEPGYLERFRREAQIASQLHSRHIVRILDSGNSDGRYFIAMEYVEGQTLAKRLENGALPVEEAIRICHEVCTALIVAHQHGVVHRDIKPQNILLDLDGTAKVTDFGVARRQGQPGITVDGLYLGTPEYMAPEQVDGHADIRSDIYSFGILTYQMLAGRVPFRGETPWATLDQQMRSDPLPLGAIRNDVPAWLSALVMRCLRKDPRSRFQTPQSLLQALDARENSSTSHTVRQQASLRAGSTYRNSSWVRTVWLAGLLITIAAIGFAAAPALRPFAGLAIAVAFLLLGGRLLSASQDSRTRTRFARAKSRSSYVAVTSDGRRTSLPLGRSYIGRDAASDLRLLDASVSRRHARLTVSPSEVLVEDLNSQNGTRLNGQPTIRAVVGSGDKLAFGKAEVVIEDVRAP